MESLNRRSNPARSENEKLRPGGQARRGRVGRVSHPPLNLHENFAEQIGRLVYTKFGEGDLIDVK
jgi:hypothetical protein